MVRIVSLALVLVFVLLPVGALGSNLSSLDDEALAQLIEQAQQEQQDRIDKLPKVDSASLRAHKYEGDGWATPEEAVQVYLAGLKALDLDKMLSAFAIESFVDHYHFAAKIEDMDAYNYHIENRLPSTNDLFTSLNVETRKGGISDAIFFQAVSIILPDVDFIAPNTMRDYEGGSKAFVDKISVSSPLIIEDLDLVEFVAPEALSDTYLLEPIQKNLQRQMTFFGADEFKSIALYFTCNNQKYIFCCDVLRYGEKWYLGSLNSHIGMILEVPSTSRGIMPIN